MQKRKVKRRTYLIITILFVTFWYIIKAPPFSSSDLVKSILEVNSSDIARIEVGPLKYIIVDNNITTEKIVITDKDFIRRFCKALNASEKHSPDHPKARWHCVITLVQADREISFPVRNTIRNRNGTYFNVWSRAEWGWLLGTYRSDKIGEFIEEYLISSVAADQ